MRLFAELYFALDTTNDAEPRTRALMQYLRKAPPEDAIWALHLLRGERPRRLLPLDELLRLVREVLSLPDWLIEESLKAVKDPLEALTLLLPVPEHPEDILLHSWLDDILPALRQGELQSLKAKIAAYWIKMDFQERFVLNKLLSGGFRLQLPDTAIVKALHTISGLDAYVLAYRLHQKPGSDAKAYRQLLAPQTADAAISRPYPFVVWESLDKNSIQAEPVIQHWHIEWEWPGLRVQCIKRQGQFFLWSQETEILTNKFPELQDFGKNLPDGTVIEAQLVGWRDDAVLPPDALQRRIRRKHLSKKLLEDIPIRGFVFDMLEEHDQDLRELPFSQRHNRLVALLEKYPHPAFFCSPRVQATCWGELDRIAELARKSGAAGLLLIPCDAAETKDAPSGNWWRWKAQPLTVLGVLLYVQRRQGASLESVTEYSLGVQDENGFVKIAATTGDFSTEEQKEIDLFVKDNTIERFGPVRSVKAELVFELRFDGIRKSSRHKAGLKLDSPEIICWHREKNLQDVGTLTDLWDSLCQEGTGES